MAEQHEHLESMETMENAERLHSKESQETAVELEGGQNLDHTTDTVKKIRAPRSERKRQMYVKMLAERKESRRLKKMRKKENISSKEEVQGQMHVKDEDRLTKKEIKEQIQIRLKQALQTGQRICVDLSMEDTMTMKEKGKLAQQICRLYGANRKSEEPAHVYLTGLNKKGELYAECVRKNEGFQNYLLDMTEKRHTEIFNPKEIVYLTPDAETALTDIDPSKVYILGGLVDESINKNLSKTGALSAGITTARLPISEHMEKVKDATYYSQVLAINQVFEILLNFMRTKDWRQSLPVGVPKRNGYILKPP